MKIKDSKNKIILVSGSGLLGSALFKLLPHNGFEVAATGRGSGNGAIFLDLENPVAPQIENELKKKNHNHGIICAALTDVQECYQEPEKSHRINVEAMGELLTLFKEFRIKPIFFSSDLVFDNSTGFYDESALPNPVTRYGKQKLAIEQKIRAEFSDHLIFRTSKLMSMDLHPRSILTGLIQNIRAGEEIRAFRDQYISPAFVEDVARIVSEAIQANLTGTYHLAGIESFNRYELAQIVGEALGIEPKNLRAISMKDIFKEARGPNNTLCAQKITDELGGKFTPVREGLKRLLK